jgi:hypothetical protein
MKSTRGVNWTRQLFVPVVMIALVAFCLCVASPAAVAQNAGTGAIAGTITDPTDKAVLEAQITATNQETGAKVTVKSQSGGTYTVPLLLPGLYTLEVSKDGFKSSVVKDIRVNVTETAGLNMKLELGLVTQTIVVRGEATPLQTESSTEGTTTAGNTIKTLPLATRNYTQIIGLNPNVSTGVTNATTLGRGNDIYGAGVSANGVPTNDNNTLMDGVEINDRQQSGQFSSGVAIPNPDSISEFRVQTSQYDASFGRDAGANVNVVTKGGTNHLHGDAWEYFRDTVMNANDYFLKRSEILSGQPNTPPVLNQNQFGGDLGGRIKKDKLLFYTSYQGTRSKNGFSGSCLTTINGIAGLTNTNRTAAGLGAAFAGDTGQFGGEAILANGSNISQQAINLLNLKLPNGQFVIPSPPAGQSSLTVTNPCPFNEDQFLTNADFIQSSKSRFSARFFFADDLTTETHPSGGAVSGTPYNVTANYRNFSLTHDYTISSRLVNQAELGFHRTYTNAQGTSPFTFSGIGASVPSFDNTYPILVSESGFSIFSAPGASGQLAIGQTTYVGQDSLSYVIGRHTLRFGGGVDHLRENRNLITGDEFIVFGLPDLLLGGCALPTTTMCPGTGTASVPAVFGNGSTVSNVFASEDFPPGFDTQELVTWDFNAYAQDDFKVTPRLTLNLGIRFDRNGYQDDALGKNVGFDPSKITPYSVPVAACTTPNGTGSLLGYTVSSNFPGTLPCSQVTKINSESGFNPGRNNTWNPRVGFAWRIPHTERVVVRGGYGVYHSVLNGQPQLNTTEGQPFFSIRVLQAGANGAASLGQPFQPSTTVFPSYTPYTAASTQSVLAFDPNLKIPMIQEYSLNVQTELAKDLVLEIGYSGSRGVHLFDDRSVNQACVIGQPGNDGCPASLPSLATTNTAANIQARVPYEGISSSALLLFQSDASFWYNALVVGLTKRVGHGLQFQISYTWDKEMETFAGGGVSTGANGATVVGDANNPLYGPDGGIRPQRFVASYVYDLPSPKDLRSIKGEVLGGWQLTGVTTYQAGQFLTITNSSNANNIYGDTGAGAVTASLAAGCSVSGLDNPGTIQSKIGTGGAVNYFNKACITTPAVSPFATGTGTGFGTLGAGIVRGPDQANWDMSLSKRFSVRWPNEIANVMFRADFFNVFNHTQFANPSTSFGTGTFGEITATSVNPRIIQLALRYNF